MAQAEKLRLLKNMIGELSPREKFPFSYAHLAIPRAALTEITGPGKTEFVIRFLSERTELRVAWIEKELSIYPLSLRQRNLDLERFLFIEGKREVIWAALQVLKSQLFQVVVLSPTPSDIQELRKLQLASEKANASLLLLSEKSKEAWPVSLQIQVHKIPFTQNFEIQIIRSRL